MNELLYFAAFICILFMGMLIIGATSLLLAYIVEKWQVIEEILDGKE